VIDANRDPTGASLYPGQNTTGLCPTTDFDGRPIYRDGATPTKTRDRRAAVRVHTPYHDALAAALEAAEPVTALPCCTIAIRSARVCRSCSTVTCRYSTSEPTMGRRARLRCAPPSPISAPRPDGYDHVVDGRFKGGWTTRRYGRPAAGLHAIQMELAQRAYMDEAPPWRFDDARAEALRGVLAEI
jgi:N-formylglutamate deformylase